MQFIAGDDLARVITERGKAFPPQQVIAWADQLLDALIYLHARDRQVVHRDIKPHNLKITETGQIALLDFGLAKADEADHSTSHSSHSVFGYTRRYSPLEQMQDQGTSPQSDIYALGATLYHLLTGEKPPDAMLRAAITAEGKPDPLHEVKQNYPGLGVEITAILQKAMEINARDRYASASEFRAALRQLGRHPQSLATNTSLQTASSGNSVAVNTVMVSGAVKTDPFDSYSILKPESDVFRVTTPRRWPALVVVGFAVILVTIAASFPSGLLRSLEQLFASSNAAALTDASNAVSLKATKTDSAVTKTTPARSNQAPPAVESGRAGEAAKKRSRRNQPRQPLSARPPPISITPDQ
jgi:serine/threonine protein kinase